MTDTPVLPQSWPPPSRLDQIKAFVGDLARPFAIISAACAAFYAVVRIADAIGAAIKAGHGSFEGAAIFVGTVLAGVGAIYIGKVLENNNAAKQDAIVKVAEIKATPAESVPSKPAEIER